MEYDIAKVLKMILSQQPKLQPLPSDNKKDRKVVLIEDEFTKKLMQEQQNSVTSIYMEYVEKKPGLILNDPSGCGKRVQAALFLKIIQHDLHPHCPGLIICYDDDMYKWRTCFKTWYHSITADLIYGTGNPFAIKKIFVLSPTDVIKYCRNKFTVVVVDNCSDEDLNTFKRINLMADFKIWITNKELKNNLGFTSIYEWMYPNKKFNPWEFIETSNQLDHILEKKLKFERFLDSFILRRKDEEHLSSNVNVDPNKELHNQPSNPVSIKNKDPTGTKVKSSKKRKLTEGETSATLDNNEQVSTVNSLDGGNAGLQMIIKTYGNVEESNPELPHMNTAQAEGTNKGNISVLSKDDNTIASTSYTIDEELLNRKAVFEQILYDYFTNALLK